MAFCEICSRPLNKREEQYIQIPGTEETHCVCAGCRSNITTLTGGTANMKLLGLCAEEMASYLENGQVNDSLREYIISIMPDNAEDIKGVEEWQRSLKEIESDYLEAVARLEQTEKEKLANFKLTTGYKFDGYETTRYIKVVSGEVVMGGGMFKEIAASASDVFGVRAGGFESNLSIAKDTALNKAKLNALKAGANALLGIDFDIATIGNSMMVVSVSATAVYIKRQGEIDHGTYQMS